MTQSSQNHILRLQSIVWQILSCACFAAINGMVRYLSGGSSIICTHTMPITTMVFFQNVLGLMFMMISGVRLAKSDLVSSNWNLHILRVFLAVVGVVLWYLALKFMPIAQAIALNVTGPVFTILGAKIFLKEKLGGVRGCAILMSFIGSCMILRPDQSISHYADLLQLCVIFPMLSAIALSGVKICSRKLSIQGCSAQSLTTFLLVFMTPISFVFALIEGFVWPTLDQWWFLLIMGALSTCAHLATCQAYRNGEVTFVMPFGLSKVILSSAIGWLVFDEYPQTWTIVLGLSIIMLCVLLLSYQGIFYRGKKCKKNIV